MKDKIVFPNIITDIFLFFLKQEPSALWLMEGSAAGAAAPARAWNLQPAIHQRIARSHSSRLCLLSPGVRGKEMTACQPPRPGRGLLSASAPRRPPLPGNTLLVLFFPRSCQAFRPSTVFSRIRARPLLLPTHPATSCGTVAGTADCPLPILGTPWLAGVGETPCPHERGRLSKHSGQKTGKKEPFPPRLSGRPGAATQVRPSPHVPRSPANTSLYFPAAHGCRQRLCCYF